MWILLEQVTNISSAQLLAMNTTPVEIIPAPPAGYVNVPVGLSWVVRPGSVPYSGNSGIKTAYGGGAAAYTTFGAGLNATVSTVGTALAPSVAAAAASTLAGNITASVAAPFTNGNGTLSVLCKYYTKQL